jgi:hypothetical protein
VVYQVLETEPDPQGSRPSRADFWHAVTILIVVKHIPSLAMVEQLHALKRKVGEEKEGEGRGGSYGGDTARDEAIQARCGVWLG